jgi:hypothetical protein
MNRSYCKLAVVGVTVVLALILAGCTSAAVPSLPSRSGPRSSPASADQRPPTVLTSGHAEGPANLLSVDFATAQDGAVAFTQGRYGGAGGCVVQVEVTTDAGRSFRPPVSLASKADCYPLSPSVALRPNGTGWAVAVGRLWAVSNDWKSWRVAPAFSRSLGPLAAHYRPCAVVVQGASVWVTSGRRPATSCSPSLLLWSTNSGRTWRTRVITHPTGGYGPGDSGTEMALSSGSTGAIFGCVTACSGPKPPSLTLLSTTEDAGVSWSTHKLCAHSDNGALIAAFATNLTVACLGPVSSGAQAITVLSSNDGGRSWQEMCANGDFDTWPTRGSCPRTGYPSSLVATSDGTLLMGLARGGVYTSTDGGATWRLTESITAGYPVDVASVAKDAWADSPSATSVFASTNGGRSWVGLPFRSG